MRVSSRLGYALSCLLRVAEGYPKRVVSIKEISLKEKIAPDYIEQLLLIMKRAGILKSVRGRSGGYVLNALPKDITPKSVVEAIEGEVLGLVCYRKKGRKKKCIHLNDCKVRDFWLDMRKNMESFLDGYTLKDILSLRKSDGT